MKMKGILLAGGGGTRLHPVTRVVSKHLLPIYEKPMFHYPLSTLMLAGIRKILLISTPRDLPLYEELLGDGSGLGLDVSYAEQPRPDGLAQAFVIGEEFIGNDSVAMILGDNVFYAQGLSGLLQQAVKNHKGATVFGYQVDDPGRYGVAAFNKAGHVTRIIEKPSNPPSNIAITGLYLYDGDVAGKARKLRPSARGEIEITDLNQNYIDEGRLSLVRLGRGAAWLDAGTYESLHEASSFIRTIERRQGLQVACLEEIGYRMGFIDEDQLQRLAKGAPTDGQRHYLERLLRESQGRLVGDGVEVKR